MKNKLFLLFLSFLSFLCFVKASDEREYLTNVVATSNAGSIFVYDSEIATPTFNVTTGSGSYFVNTQEGGWYRYNGERWLKVLNGYNFNSGRWHYRTQLRIDSDEYQFSNQTKVKVDGEEWYFSYCSSCSGSDYSVGWVTSPSYTLDESGVLSFFEREEQRIYNCYINEPIYSFSVSGSVEGGTGPYTFSKTSGPSWINVSTDGTISGTPTQVGDNEDLVVRVTDNDSNYKEITIPVNRTILTPNLRELITNITATSNTSTIPVLGNNIINPTFNITNVEGPFFANYNCGWYKKIGDNWVEQTGEFTPGKWQYRAQVILQNEPAESYKLSDETTVYVDGENWNAGLSGIGNEYYALSVNSKEYTINGKINSIELDGTINPPRIGDDIVEPIIWATSVNGDDDLTTLIDVNASWEYKTGDNFFDWEEATGKFEADKTYHIRFMISVEGEIYELENIAVFPVIFNNYELTQFQLNNKTVGEYIDFDLIEPIKVPEVKIKSDNNKITLTWPSQMDAIKYKVYRSTDGKKFTKLGDVKESSFTEKGLTYGKTYYYKVKSCDNVKCTTYSDVVSKKIKPNKVVLNIMSAGSNNIKLSWDKVSTTGYQISRSTDNKKWTTIKTITKNTTLEYNNKSLKANKTYYYKVRAYKTVSGKKIYGSWSSVVSTKTAPSKPECTLSIKEYNEVNIKVNEAKGANHYIIYKSIDGLTYEKVYDLPTYGITVDGENEIGKTYYYKIKVCNKYGNCSGKVSLSIKQTTKTPSLSVDSLVTKKVNIKVGSVNMADGYRVYRSTSKNGKYELIKEIKNIEELEFNDKTKKGYTYYYKVRSYKVVGDSKVYSPYSKIKKVISK